MQALTFDPERRHNLMHSGDDIFFYNVWFMAEHSLRKQMAPNSIKSLTTD